MSSDCKVHTNAEDANFDRCSICAHARIRELEAELAAEKENSARGWELFERFRKKYAELRFPGMTAEVHAALVPKEPPAQNRGGEHE